MKPQNIIAQINKNIKKKKWDCIIDNCSEQAINSHLIQQNGILNNIADDGHLIELQMTDAYKWNKNESPFNFKKLGITQALSHKVFCNNHDTRIFQSIENNSTDFESYNSFLLFSYRAVCAEIRKKQIAIEQYKRLLNANTLTGIIDKDALRKISYGNELGINDLNALREMLENEINNKNNEYSFFVYTYPKIDVYASSVFSALDIDYPENEKELDLENIYLHILPLKTKTLIIAGFHNKYSSKETKDYCKSWDNLSKNDLEFKITDLFSTKIENWGIAPNYFNKLKEKNKEKYVNDLRENASYFGTSDKRTAFNLFDID